MAVATEQTFVSYVGNDSTVTPYPVPFRVLEAEHIVVARRSALDPQSVYAIMDPGDYEVTLIAETGMAEVRTAYAWDGGNDIGIWRSVPITQNREYPVSGPFPAKSHEGGLDKACMIDQELFERLSRTLRIRRDANESGPLVLPPAKVGVMGFRNGDNGPEAAIYDFWEMAAELPTLEGLQEILAEIQAAAEPYGIVAFGDNPTGYGSTHVTF